MAKAKKVKVTKYSKLGKKFSENKLRLSALKSVAKRKNQKALSEPSG